MADYELYIVRHDIAEERGDAWPDDTKRPLTEEGMHRMRRAARSLARIGVCVDVVLTSPLVRTRQTAELFAAAFSPHPAVVNLDALGPDGSASAIIAELDKYSKKKRIAMVGHEPGVGDLASRLAGMKQPMEFKKGAICRIDFEVFPPKGRGQLRWFVTPKMLRKLA